MIVLIGALTVATGRIVADPAKLQTAPDRRVDDRRAEGP